MKQKICRLLTAERRCPPGPTCDNIFKSDLEQSQRSLFPEPPAGSGEASPSAAAGGFSRTGSKSFTTGPGEASDESSSIPPTAGTDGGRRGHRTLVNVFLMSVVSLSSSPSKQTCLFPPAVTKLSPGA